MHCCYFILENLYFYSRLLPPTNDNADQLRYLIKKVRYFLSNQQRQFSTPLHSLLSAYPGFDWFMSSIYLIMGGKVDSTWSFLSSLSSLLSSGYIWMARLHSSVRTILLSYVNFSPPCRLHFSTFCCVPFQPFLTRFRRRKFHPNHLLASIMQTCEILYNTVYFPHLNSIWSFADSCPQRITRDGHSPDLLYRLSQLGAFTTSWDSSNLFSISNFWLSSESNMPALVAPMFSQLPRLERGVQLHLLLFGDGYWLSNIFLLGDLEASSTRYFLPRAAKKLVNFLTRTAHQRF